jgi:hypothetical protein
MKQVEIADKSTVTYFVSIEKWVGPSGVAIANTTEQACSSKLMTSPAL